MNQNDMNQEKYDSFKKAYDLWTDFKKEVLYTNRFHIKHSVLDYIESIADRTKTVIKNDTILYRARIYENDTSFVNYIGNTEYDDIDTKDFNQWFNLMNKSVADSKAKSGFWGYDKDNSFIPKNNNLVGEGRTNPSYIKYLYTAESPYTALTEVRPYLGACVSIAEIKIIEDLSIADFSLQGMGNNLDLENSIYFENNLMYLIMGDFSKPINADKKDYIPTQYIAEYIKKLGYEGIRFNSSLHKYGINVTIFNFNKCEAINSKLYKVEDICLESNCIAPIKESGLDHPKLKPYKQEQLEQFLLSLLNKANDS